MNLFIIIHHLWYLLITPSTQATWARFMKHCVANIVWQILETEINIVNSQAQENFCFFLRRCWPISKCTGNNRQNYSRDRSWGWSRLIKAPGRLRDRPILLWIKGTNVRARCSIREGTTWPTPCQEQACIEHASITRNRGIPGMGYLILLGKACIYWHVDNIFWDVPFYVS